MVIVIMIIASTMMTFYSFIFPNIQDADAASGSACDSTRQRAPAVSNDDDDDDDDDEITTAAGTAIATATIFVLQASSRAGLRGISRSKGTHLVAIHRTLSMLTPTIKYVRHVHYQVQDEREAELKLSRLELQQAK